jgi:hypothetical protein
MKYSDDVLLSCNLLSLYFVRFVDLNFRRFKKVESHINDQNLGFVCDLLDESSP